MKTVSAIIAFFTLGTLSVSGQWSNGADIYNATSGNVGINTTTPQSKLHIAGNNTTPTAPILILQNNIYGGMAGSLRFASGYNNFDSWSGIEAYNPAGIDQQDLRFFTTYGSRGERMRIDPSGRIGIGTTTPENGYLLDVNGAVVFRNKVSMGPDVWHTSLDGASRFYFGNYDRTYFGSKNGYEFRSSGDAALAVLSNAGNLGIGTVTPLAKLDVNGNIFTNSKILIGTTDLAKVGNYSLAVNGDAIFKKVRVQSSWADFVFDEKYHLLPLEEVEQFIKANKHLPEVPTAAEVEKDGIDIGSTQTILLQKIEELTLYAIEQNKKATAQQEQINILLKELAALKDQQKK